MNSLTIKVYIEPGYNAGDGKLILNNVEYSSNPGMPGSDNDYEYYFYFDNPVSLPATGQLFITDGSNSILPFDHNGTIQVNQGYGIWNYDSNNPCYMEFELEQDGQSYGDPSIEFGSVSNPWYYNQYQVSTCNTPTTHTVSLSCDGSKGHVCYSTDGTTWSTPLVSTSTTVNHGDIIYIKANPETGYQFQKWSDDSTSNPNTLTVTGDVTLSAAFESDQPTTYDITTDITGDGTVSGINNPYASGDTATVTATANSGSHFVCFNIGENVSIDNPKTFYVVENTNLKVYFSEDSDPLSGNGHWETNIDGTVYSMTFNGTTNEAALFTDSYGYYYVYDNGTIKTILKSTGEINTMSYNSLNNTITYFGYDFTWVSDGPQPTTYTVTVNVTGQGTTTGAGDYEEGAQVTLTATPSTGYEFSSWQINGTVVETNSTYQFIMGNQDVTITAVFEEEAEKHIYLCDNSGAHLAEMTKTGSTWSVTGAFTSGMYSIRATVENEYEDAWFKFYQTNGDNRIFVGAGDDPSFEDIGTYIMIDDILTSFSLTEDQETGYYVVNYQNIDAMTVSTVDNIVNSYIGDFVTGSEISAMGYMTQTDISSMGYMTATDISSMGYMTQTDISAMSYVSQTALSAMGYVTAGEIPTPDLTNCVKYADLNVYAYVSQPALSAMSYVDNSYLSTYMNNVVGNIESILQTI